MRTDFIHDWVAALRSGDFHQGQQQLRMAFRVPSGDHVAHCCLGVACEIGIRYGVVQRLGDAYIAIGEAADIDGDVADYNSATLPMGFWQWIGLEGSDPRVTGLGSLSMLNDDGGMDFHDIANLIEDSWLAPQLTKEMADA